MNIPAHLSPERVNDHVGGGRRVYTAFAASICLRANDYPTSSSPASPLSMVISPDAKVLTFSLPSDVSVLAGTLPSCVKVKETIVQPDGTAAVLDKS